VVGLDPYTQFGEDEEGGGNRAEIAKQLPATTFWAFAKEFFTKLPELFLGENIRPKK
jgi:hypothetical protein